MLSCLLFSKLQNITMPTLLCSPHESNSAVDEPSFNNSHPGCFPALHQLFVSSSSNMDPQCSRRLTFIRPQSQMSRPPLREISSSNQLVGRDTRHSLPFASVEHNLTACLPPKFRPHYRLIKEFVEIYQLEDELGSGGFGFVMTARHREEGLEVAVKFIIKSKVPARSWIHDDIIGKLPTEVVVLCLVDHQNIVKCLDIFEDFEYIYLVRPSFRLYM
jgi:hypothetical protein